MNEELRRKIIPVTNSRFLRVKCPKCGNEQIIFDRASIVVKCNVCGEVLAKPTGGKAEIFAKILEVLE